LNSDLLFFKSDAIGYNMFVALVVKMLGIVVFDNLIKAFPCDVIEAGSGSIPDFFEFYYECSLGFISRCYEETLINVEYPFSMISLKSHTYGELLFHQWHS
jgi:hypothetical protein